MITQYHKLALTASLVFAMAFIFSCSGDGGGGDNPGGGTSGDNGGSSSSGGGSDGSSSSVSSSGNSSSSSGGSSSSFGGSSSSVTGNSSSSEAPKCGNRTQAYDPGKYECRADINPNGIYLKGGVNIGGKPYNAVLIGEQTWMAENLTYNVSGSRCYGEGGQIDEDKDAVPLSDSEIQTICNEYGRLYDWAAAMTVCPDGWHLPTGNDWDKLTRYVNSENNGYGEVVEYFDPYYSSRVAGRYLKSVNSWHGGNYQDIYGFSAMRLGYGYYREDEFYFSRDPARWWSATEIIGDDGLAFSWYIHSDDDLNPSIFPKLFLLGVRCVQN